MPIILEKQRFVPDIEASNNAGYRFHDETRQYKLRSNPNFRRIESFNSNKNFLETIRYNFKTYLHAEKTPLPPLSSPPSDSYEDIINRRNSCRSFSNKSITRETLFDHIQLSYKKFSFNNQESSNTEGLLSRRTTASAGGLNSLELYFCALNVSGLKPGVYHYNVGSNNIELIKLGDFKGEIIDLFSLQHDRSSVPSVVYFITSIHERVTIKYGARGFRYIYMEAGALSHSLSLATSKLNLGGYITNVCIEEDAEKLLGLNSFQELFLLSYFLGQTENKK